MGNHGKFSVSPLKSDLSFLPSFPQGERVLGDAEVPLYRRRSSVVTGGHFSLVIFPWSFFLHFPVPPWLPGGTDLSCTFVFLSRVPCLPLLSARVLLKIWGLRKL